MGAGQLRAQHHSSKAMHRRDGQSGSWAAESSRGAARPSNRSLIGHRSFPARRYNATGQRAPSKATDKRARPI